MMQPSAAEARAGRRGGGFEVPGVNRTNRSGPPLGKSIVASRAFEAKNSSKTKKGAESLFWWPRQAKS